MSWKTSKTIAGPTLAAVLLISPMAAAQAQKGGVDSPSGPEPSPENMPGEHVTCTSTEPACAAEQATRALRAAMDAVEAAPTKNGKDLRAAADLAEEKAAVANAKRDALAKEREAAEEAASAASAALAKGMGSAKEGELEKANEQKQQAKKDATAAADEATKKADAAQKDAEAKRAELADAQYPKTVADLNALVEKAGAAVVAMRNLQLAAGLSPSLALDAILAELRARVLEFNLLAVDKKKQTHAETTEDALRLAQSIVDSFSDQRTNAQRKKEADNDEIAAEAERLLKYGVTFGVAATVNLPIHHQNPELGRLDTPAAGVMPYLLFMPAFWGSNAASQAYCAADWSASDEARNAAGQKYLEELVRRYRQELAHLAEDEQELLGSGDGVDEAALLEKVDHYNMSAPAGYAAPRIHDEPASKRLAEAEEKLRRTILERDTAGTDQHAADRATIRILRLTQQIGALRALTQLETSDGQPKKLKEIRAKIADKKKKLRDLQIDGYARKCHLFKWLGLYVGYPGMFDATTTVPRGTVDDKADRDVNPIISFGWAAAPNAMVSAMAGATVGTINRDDNTDATFWAMTVGIGGSADLINLVK